MKRVEITFTKYQKELEKLNAQLDRAQKAYDKKYANAVKYGVQDWDRQDRLDWVETTERTPNGFFINKSDEKINGAWWDLFMATESIKDIEERIQNAERRLEKAENEVNKYYNELDKIADMKAKEEFAKRTFEEEQKEWAKDGITLEGRYYGTTPKGEKFDIYGNNGFANRSMHCFTLRIGGRTIFTSGEFWRAYAVIRNS